jgi:electron transfer flavoprotein alpha subunit
MSVLIFVEFDGEKAKKTGREAIYFGAELAKKLNTQAKAIVVGVNKGEGLALLGASGASEVLLVNNSLLNTENILAYSSAISQIAKAESASCLIFAKSSLGDAVAARVAASLQAGLVANVVDMPEVNPEFILAKPLRTAQ